MPTDIISKLSPKIKVQAEALVLEHLTKAIAYRNEGKAPEVVRNTYLQDLSIPQIVLFDILANKFPLVLQSQTAINRLICQHAKKCKSITLLDIGTGRGIQLLRLLKMLNEIQELQHVKIIGIELFAPALKHTEEQLQELGKVLRIDLNFIPINSSVESTDFERLKSIIAEDDFPLMINASLCLHHIQSQELRNRLFDQVHLLNPELLTIIEPHANCFTDEFEVRLENAFQHFNALYNYINTLELKDEEKTGLKQFFSTELFDAIALPDNHRFEKYEEGERWVELGKRAGFIPVELSETASGINFPSIDVKTAPEGFISFSYQGTGLLSVMAFARK